jgi:hypothetical protein
MDFELVGKRPRLDELGTLRSPLERSAVERRRARSSSICFSMPGLRTFTITSRPLRRSAV